MLIPIANPLVYQTQGSNACQIQKDPLPEKASQDWFAGSFVYRSGTGASAVIETCLSDSVLCYGASPDRAYGSGTAASLLKPPNTLFGLNHYPFDPRDVIFSVNISNASASGANLYTTSGVTWAGGGTNGVALAPGQQYGLIRPTSGTYQGIQLLDVTDTTNKFFEIVGLAPYQSVDDNNPRVLVKILPTIIQG